MSCKIDTVVQKHDLDISQAGYGDIDEYLLQRWTGEDGRPAEGYRSLTEWFNKRLLKRVYDEHNRQTTGVKLESEYDVLQSKDELTRQELEDDLRTTGIDADEVTADMISWSTMRHHLNDCLDGTKEMETADSDWERKSVEIASEQVEEKAVEAVRSLSSKGEIADSGEPGIAVNVNLSCPECHVQTPFSKAVERGYVCGDHAHDDPENGDGEPTRSL
ncbi:rod-determining factor RdfA [Halostella pelagica]|uniref:rod-determining factor RdfA n=1 Tax=Halostella pelagica TaxID=2583824 RepID=UPI00108028C0|nr:rod-determining factor RdfA [Halostella pelagica]